MAFVKHDLIREDLVESRLYQEVLVSRAIEKGNTLVVAPTALGKTVVAIMLSAYKIKNNPNAKILFMAPTKPLAVQHEKSFQKFMNLEEEKIISVTGATSPAKRKEQYKHAQIINATPQTIENDLLNGLINFREFDLVIFDEAHRAVGDYAYVFINNQVQRQNSKTLVLALTASPGSEEEKIQDVCRNLSIKNIEIMSNKDAEVKPYINEITAEWIKVDMPQEFLEIKELLGHFMRKQLHTLKLLGLAVTENKNYYNRTRLLEMQGKIRQRLMSHGSTQPSLFAGASKCASLLKIAHAEELIETQGIAPLKNYFDSLRDEARKGQSKAAGQIVADEDVQKAITLTEKLFEKNVQHPKYEELRKLVEEQLQKHPESKILVFNHYRDSIKEVVKFLNNSEGVRVEKFIGQGNKRNEKGMSQKLQQEVLVDLKSGKFNVLVTSSVAEEGLDIPSVDLVVFFEPVPSEIRTIQRRGRTGRFGKGRMVVLMAKGTRDEAFYWVAKKKESKMNSILREMKGSNHMLPDSAKRSSKATVLPEQMTLSSFNESKDEIIIFVDSREHASTVAKDLFEYPNVKVRMKPLDVGDYVLSQDVCVERKTIEDFVNSMIDGRMFNQLVTLRSNYNKPLVIVEGNMNEIFSLRNIHRNSIIGALTSIALDYQVPVINTKSSKETAEYLYLIAKREQLGREKEVRLRVGRKGLTLDEQQRFIVEGIPMVGPNMAKLLLEKFGSIKAIANASEKKLQKVENLGTKKAKLILKVMNEKYDVKENNDKKMLKEKGESNANQKEEGALNLGEEPELEESFQDYDSD